MDFIVEIYYYKFKCNIKDVIKLEKENVIRFIKESFLRSNAEKQKKLQELLNSVLEMDDNKIDEQFYYKIINQVNNL